ncbi:MAG: hypothetical protein ACLGIR_00020 [Actinomycetes bacterium]
MLGLDRRQAIGVGAAGAAVVLGVALVVVIGVIPYPDLVTVSEQPSSPVPGRLAYVQWEDGEGACLWVADGDGSTRRLRCDEGLGGGVVWSDDGTTVDVAAYGPREPTVETIDVATGDVVDSRPLDVEEERGPVAFGEPGPIERERDGATLLVDREDGEPVVQIRAAGETTTLLRLDGPNSYRFDDARWSPDGEWVLVVDSLRRALVLPADGDAAPRVWVEDVGWELDWWQPGT